MRYRKFGNVNFMVSALGFGAMRLPIIGGDPAAIDEKEATRMVRHAIDSGVNYVDTAYGYHRGKSEVFLGEALKGGYRERIKLATKMPCWLVKAHEDFDRIFKEQLQRLQTDHIDFYLLHSLNKESWKRMQEQDILKWAAGKMKEGVIRHLGFSFHDKLDVFKEIVDASDWTFCQIQYNYMDEEEQAGTEGLKYAARKGLAVIVMEPIRGGQLARSPPKVIMDLWNTAPKKRTPTDWALQWVWNHPEVSLVLSGMSNFEQVKENVESAKGSGIGSLKDEELKLVSRVRDKYRELTPIPCTGCEYCLPCASGVKIPSIFQTYDEAIMYNDMEGSKRYYNLFLEENGRGDRCTQCKECEEKCPQGIKVSEWMPHIHKYLTEG